MSLMKITDLFNLEKGSLQSTKATPGEYDFITAAANWKTHNEYTHNCEALIFAASASGSLGRTHYVEGKFITSDLCFIITPKDQLKYPIDLKFYHIIFLAFKDEIVRNTKSGTSKASIGLTAFGNYKLPYFDLDKQTNAREKYNKVQILIQKLESVFFNQLELIKKLQQAYVVEALKGILVPQDPKDEPPKVLLNKIKAEKEDLIKANIIKKQKSLPAITEGEYYIEIPHKWEWARLIEVCDNIVDCPHSTPKYIEIDTGHYGIDTNCINDRGEIIKLRNLSKDSYSERVKRLVPQEKDLVYSREGSIGLATFIPNGKKICLGQRVMLFRPSKHISHMFLKYVVTSSKYKAKLLEKHRGIGAKHINVRDVVASIIPIPPFSEQQRIVRKLDELKSYCDNMEKRIKESQNQVKLLLQKVLHEALESKSDIMSS